MRESKTCLYEELKKMSTLQLDDMLQKELQKEHPDENAVQPILKVLEDREKGYPVEITETTRAAWDKFRENTEKAKSKKSSHKWFVRVAAVAAIVCIVALAIPQQAEADNLFDRLLRLTDSVLQFFDPDSNPGDLQREFVFETDNPGLQQLYDEVVKLGVMEPVVPMWLPEGYTLTELRITPIRGYSKIYANFANGNKSVMISLMLASEVTSAQYEMENNPIEAYEVSGINHVIIENEGKLSVAWARNGVECSIVVALEKEDLYEIIDSIYWRNTK